MTKWSWLPLFLCSGSAILAEDNQVIFNTKVLPVLRESCGACHSGPKAQNDLAVTTYESLLQGGKHGQAIVPGSSKTSLLMQYVKGEKTPQMPLGGSLAPEQIAALAAAIDTMTPVAPRQQARDEYLEWLLRPPKVPSIPNVANAGWVKNPIDVFVLAKLESKQMHPAPPANRRVLIRRAYFDLIGLPPTPEEVAAFLRDRDPKAWENLIDRLLADPRYGERWARHWLDLARYAESDGFAVDSERPAAWRYRDYVIRAFNQDKPYDLFIEEQLAGDEVQDKRENEKDQSERLVALAFLRMAPWEADATSQQQLRQDFLNEVTGTTASVFLGLTVGCAQCHNHKYDPIPQRDFYRFQSFFAAAAMEECAAPFIDAEDPAGMKRQLRSYEDQADAARQGLEKRKQALKERFIESKHLKPDAPAVAEFMDELNVANAFFQERTDPIFKEAVWKQYLSALDEVHRIEELEQRFRPVAYSVRDLVPPLVPEVPSTYVLRGGDLSAKAEPVEAGFPECIAGKAEPAKIPFRGGSTGRRIALAEWIASPRNPLTARVMVNRIWQYHFGEGLVRTPSDFGKNGSRTIHPELLDWLATQFIEQKWSMKAMHRLMLTSAAYQQSTAHAGWKAYSDTDPGNELLWRMNWGRLEAEVLRDSVLTLSGRLNTARGGPGALLNAPADVAEGFEFFKWFPSGEEQQRRRTIYTFQRRSVVNPMLEVFDAANIAATCPQRNRTTVAPQALTLMNGELTNREAGYFAERVLKEAGPAPAAQVERAFQIVLSRSPSKDEQTQALALYSRFTPREAMQQLGMALLNTNEFLFVE
ncbi:MAG TPA: PSD1 and planctomycete cytochrome C domain-containing protein [Bryobacteraceae bacterium]|nr:PSD1 and planctomycete cytochrome C domain-containing protein [Bryobacteraceae bacterium]